MIELSVNYLGTIYKSSEHVNVYKGGSYIDKLIGEYRDSEFGIEIKKENASNIMIHINAIMGFDNSILVLSKNGSNSYITSKALNHSIIEIKTIN